MKKARGEQRSEKTSSRAAGEQSSRRKRNPPARKAAHTHRTAPVLEWKQAAVDGSAGLAAFKHTPRTNTCIEVGRRSQFRRACIPQVQPQFTSRGELFRDSSRSAFLKINFVTNWPCASS